MPVMTKRPSLPGFRSALNFVTLFISLFTLAGCERPDPEVTIVVPAAAFDSPPTPMVTPHFSSDSAPPTPIVQRPITTVLPTYFGTPTPDPPHTVVDDEEPFGRHVVSAGDTLGYIAQIYGSSIEELQNTNQLAETDLLFVGQELLIPNLVDLIGPSFKIIPDSELIYGPSVKEFDIHAFINGSGGYLSSYEEEIEGRTLTGTEILSLVAHRYGVNPRLLIAILEYRTGWITETNVVDDPFLLGYTEGSGLYQQLGRAANELNRGYYGRAEGGVDAFVLGDGTRLAFATDINDGTAGVQNMLASHDAATYEAWLQDVGPNGLFTTFQRLFGNPFAYTVDPLWPANLNAPSLQLPWSTGESWHFTGGPHGGWASGTAWAALDFAPPDDDLGPCQSDYWVTAMSDGVVTRSDFGAVVVDLDEDGYAGIGWAITYMHLEERDRVTTGSLVQTGDRLGHPSCEGGFSNGKHVHIARTYNGRWVAADGLYPFVMSGWTSSGLGFEYDGQLTRGGIVKEACDGCREETNTITAD
jgi:murein DD-endopeptidase MepM/ murein hydrolase activator NlpD